MKRSRFSEEQIIAVLKEQEAGMPTAELCRRHAIGSATFYKWKSKFGGLEVSDARRVRTACSVVGASACYAWSMITRGNFFTRQGWEGIPWNGQGMFLLNSSVKFLSDLERWNSRPNSRTMNCRQMRFDLTLAHGAKPLSNFAFIS